MTDSQVKRDTEQALLGRAMLQYDDSIKEYRPSRTECLRDHHINIEFLSIGCIIRIGCKSVPFSTIDEGMKALNEYVANPYEQRKIWEEKFKQEEN